MLTPISLTGTFDEPLPHSYLRRALAMAGLGFWQLRPSAANGGITVRVNDAFLDMIGCARDEFPSNFDDYLKQFIHPEEQVMVAAAARAGVADRPPSFETEHRLYNRVTGQWRWVRSVGEAGRPGDGNPEVIFGCIIDIHEARTARECLAASEAALRREHQRLDAIIDASEATVWEWDLKSDQVRHGYRLPGSGEDAGRGAALADPDHQWNTPASPRDRERILAARDRHLRGESPRYEVEYQFNRPDGENIWVLDRGRVVDWDEEGRPTRMMGVTLDVSQQKATRRALAESRRRLEQVVEAANVGIWNWDATRDQVTVNDIFRRLSGYERQDLEGPLATWFELVHPDDRRPLELKLKALLEGLTDSITIEFRLRHRRGHHLWLYGVFRALDRDRDCRATRLVAVQLDFTEKKTMEQARAESLAVISSHKETLEKQVAERTRLLNDIQRRVEVMMNAPEARRDPTQRSLREEITRLAEDLKADPGVAYERFSRYMSRTFQFIANERVWYKAILDSLPFPTSVFDLGRHWTYLNRPAAAPLGVKTPAECIGRHYREVWKNFRDSDVFFQRAEVGKKNFTRHLTDSDRFFACQSSPLLDENSRVIGFIETMQDITEARLAEERMRLMLDATSLACSFFDRNGAPIDCNRAAAVMCGYADKAEYRRQFYKLMPASLPDGRPAARALLESIEKAFDQGQADMEEMRLRHIDGTEIPGEVHLTRVEWRGQFRVLGYFRDLRPLKAAQARLDGERLLLRNILEGCPVCFTIIAEGIVKYVAPYAKKVLGLEVDGGYEQIFDPEELARLKAEFYALRSLDWRPIRVRRADGSFSENLLNAYDTEFEGRPAVICWLMDVTELRLKERELEIARDLAEESTRAKSDFLANISHEIRTPMNAVIGLNHLLLQTELTGPQREYAEKTDRAAKSLLRLINDLLDFSKIEDGQFQMTPREFDLTDLLRQAADLILPQAGDKGLEFLLAVDPDTPVGLVGDDFRLLQVINNLTSNAVKFTSQGEISLAVEVAEQNETEVRLRFLIRDTGIGLAPDQIGKLFSAFTQVDTSATRRYGGTGLGLAISKRLVEMMDGEIWCESRPGRGSLFGFTARFGRHGRATRYLEDRGAFSGLSALAVDDNETALKVLQEYLTAMGFEVRTAASGPEALDIMEELRRDGRKPDLLIADWKMPEMDGPELARRIGELLAPDRVPAVIMVTTRPEDEIAALNQEAGLKAPEGPSAAATASWACRSGRDEGSTASNLRVLPKPLSPAILRLALAEAFGDRGRPGPAPAPAGPNPAGRIKHLAGARILLVEDNEVNQLVAGRILKKAGFTVRLANNGRQAVDLVETEPFDLVLMDIQMPVLDGLSATAEIRQNPAFTDLPIVAMTAHAMARDREKSLEAGMNDHLVKPLDINELFDCLARWIKRPEGGAA